MMPAGIKYTVYYFSANDNQFFKEESGNASDLQHLIQKYRLLGFDFSITIVPADKRIPPMRSLISLYRL